MRTRFVYLLFIFVCIASLSEAKVKFASVFTDNMVLQRNSKVAIWGWANPGGNVSLVCSWNPSDTMVVKSDNQSFWSVEVQTSKEGGPYIITASDGEKTELKNILLGEVWLCSGQSNMEWSVNHGILNGEAEAAAADYPNIRFYHVPKVGSESLQENCLASWEVCTPETMRKTSAIAYFFGRSLQKDLDVPIGLIVSAWGGTPAEVWVPYNNVMKNPELEKASQVRAEFDWWPKIPGRCYNSMIHPLMPYGVAGAIWYQGESNAAVGQTSTYDLLMRTLIKSWREGFKKEIPFYFVQIAPYQYGEQDKAYLVREQQEKTASYPNTGMVVLWDLVDDVKNIHPKNKQDVGQRLANWALAKNYNKENISYQSPAYQSMKIEKNKIRILFDHVSSGLKCSDKKITGFMIAGEDKQFVPAKVKIDGKTVIVSAPQVKKPVAVRFLFDNTSIGNLYTNEGLPVSPFRTDEFAE
ncbi:sialate O-acetylesterase [Massilibacteroides sp.]|uniref:sialate O-acetylesterase n=1 Tax=Massilibacteroides sp. TaxID=2034766 RepID=UPI00261EEA57|nr:sialate O-acetylesterase [Massilibacteroides sp.]MDD4516375.1 sialate O-acetylesterase [Massilibacteroides sp.]